jgi:hypothetical protein
MAIYCDYGNILLSDYDNILYVIMTIYLKLYLVYAAWTYVLTPKSTGGRIGYTVLQNIVCRTGNKSRDPQKITVLMATDFCTV